MLRQRQRRERRQPDATHMALQLYKNAGASAGAQIRGGDVHFVLFMHSLVPHSGVKLLSFVSGRRVPLCAAVSHCSARCEHCIKVQGLVPEVSNRSPTGLLRCYWSSGPCERVGEKSKNPAAQTAGAWSGGRQIPNWMLQLSIISRACKPLCSVLLAASSHGHV